MWSISEVKQIGKSAFRANYWPCVGAAFILGLLTTSFTVTRRIGPSVHSGQSADIDVNSAANCLAGLPAWVWILAAGLSISVLAIALLLRIFLINPLAVGCYSFFRENVQRDGASFDLVLSGFHDFGRTFLTLLLRDVFLLLWFLLFFIPGIVKCYSYRLVPYILTDHPELSPRQVIDLSRRMMKGHKFQAFLLDLSFIGWALLGLITFGLVLVFWTNPYVQSTNAALYLTLKKEYAGNAAYGREW